MATNVRCTPDKPSSPKSASDPAAEYARRLLRACDVDSRVSDRDLPQSAPLEWALCGAMALTGPSRGAPEFAAGPLASAASGVGLALKRLSPKAAFSSLDASALLGERAAIAGLSRRGDISAGGSARLIQTAQDEPIAINLPRDDDWALLPAWLEINDLTPNSRSDWADLSHHVSSRDGKMLVSRGRLMGLAVAAAPKRGPVARPLFRVRHGSETSRASLARPIRVLDLSNLWAGPLAGSLLAMAGFEVLKVESPVRPDGARAGPRDFFDLMNGNKHGVSLDLNAPSDRLRFEELIDQAEIVLESARPRALSQLGFDAETWVTNKPGRIWASITGYGRERDWIAFGDDAAIAAGLGWPPHSDRSAPRFCGDAIADPLAGLHVAAILLAHSIQQRGGLFDFSLVDIAAHAASAAHDGLILPITDRYGDWHVVEADQVVKIAEPRARKPHGHAPHLGTSGRTPKRAPVASLWNDESAPC